MAASTEGGKGDVDAHPAQARKPFKHKRLEVRNRT
jgi:hypothetical protein